MDYSIGPVNVNTDGSRYETIARVTRRGELRHPMPVGVHTASGWTFGRAEPLADEQDVRIVTTERPDSVVLDPHAPHVGLGLAKQHPEQLVPRHFREPRVTYNWPYLDQSDRSHTTVAVSPTGWYSNPQGIAAGLRARTNYLSTRRHVRRGHRLLDEKSAERGRRGARHPDAVAGVGARRERVAGRGCRGRRWAWAEA